LSPLRVIFFGTADLARPSLGRLAGDPQFDVVSVVTQPDRPKGRDLKVQPPPVKIEAGIHDLSVMQPERARDPQFIAQLAALSPELIVVAAYGQILPKALLDLPRWGCLNVHASLLPKYRGAAPIQWAILNDEPETGVTIMKMDAGLDTGDILTQEASPVLPSDTAQSLHDRLAKLGADLLIRTIPNYIDGHILPTPQPAEGVIYARKIAKADGHIDWTLSARALWNRIRAFNPWPGAFTSAPTAPAKTLVKVWEADAVEDVSGKPGEIIKAGKAGILVGCGKGALQVRQLQREGGRRMTALEFLTGHVLKPGERFGEQ
jgi:methionyl-tRNA formyltransferase